ncbi:LPP20 family lipoprotein [Psychromonas aquimarina]|uniref:LPP20 family lipoprotein n=1 Tax=Psychromonas aquimarina TaxID=444919 RepID=UPI00040CF9F5|nr:LPP20 family lipoprotein [Psychromonas aquimarina]
MKIKINLALLLVCSLLSACASTQQDKRPAWIDNAQASYASSDYLTAVGQASKRDRAGKNAVANLAEIFFVNVKAETRTLTEATKSQSALGVSSESSTNLQRSIQTETDQALSGVIIKETWLSPGGEYYALAVLAKRPAAETLYESIMELDNSIAQLLDYSANTAPNAILSINALRKARDQQLRRHMANLQLKQLSRGGLPADISGAQIEKLIADKLAALQVSVDVDSAAHKKTIQSGLAGLGVSVVDNSDLQVSADIDISDPALLEGWYWLRGSYALSLSENGQVISRKRWPVKVSAKQQEQLNHRLQDNINGKIADYLVELISDTPSF